MEYKVRKFPSHDEQTWSEGNREFIDRELEKYKDLFKEEELNNVLGELLAEFLFLHNLKKDIVDWRGEFLRYLAHMIETTEAELERKDSAVEKGRLSILRDILKWF